MISSTNYSNMSSSMSQSLSYSMPGINMSNYASSASQVFLPNMISNASNVPLGASCINTASSLGGLNTNLSSTPSSVASDSANNGGHEFTAQPQLQFVALGSERKSTN